MRMFSTPSPPPPGRTAPPPPGRTAPPPPGWTAPTIRRRFQHLFSAPVSSTLPTRPSGAALVSSTLPTRPSRSSPSGAAPVSSTLPTRPRRSSPSGAAPVSYTSPATRSARSPSQVQNVTRRNSTAHSDIGESREKISAKSEQLSELQPVKYLENEDINASQEIKLKISAESENVQNLAKQQISAE